jgi:hypothetical protein
VPSLVRIPTFPLGAPRAAPRPRPSSCRPGSGPPSRPGTGRGWISRLWVALLVGGTGVNLWRNYRVRVTFDAAAIPQIGGANGIPLGVWQMMLRGDPFMVTRVGTDRDTGTRFAGYVTHPMPYGSGFTVEIQAPVGATGDTYCFCNVDAHSAPPPPRPGRRPGAESWRLYAYEHAHTDVPFDVEVTLFDHVGDAILTGIYQDTAGATGFAHLEGDHRVYAGTGLTQAWRGSGTEDFYSRSYYAESGVSANERAGWRYGTSPNASMYRLWDAWDGWQSTGRLRLTWNNSDTSWSTHETATVRGLALFYSPTARTNTAVYEAANFALDTTAWLDSSAAGGPPMQRSGTVNVVNGAAQPTAGGYLYRNGHADCTADFTVTAWAKQASGTGDYHVFLDNVTVGGGFSLLSFPDDSLQIGHQSGNAQVVAGFADGTFKFLCIRFTYATHSFRVRVNGGADVTVTPVAVGAAAVPLTVGNRQGQSFPPTGVKKVRVWRKALSDAEVAAIYAEG